MTNSEPEPDSQPALTQDARSQTLSRRNWLTGLAAAPLVSGLPDLQASDDTPPDEQEWAFATEGEVRSSPAVVDGTVYVGSRDENLYAVDTATGEQEWVFETGGEVNSSPAVVDGTVYVGSFDQNLYAVDAATGAEQWAFETRGGLQSSPAVVDGTVYVGCVANKLYAVDVATGSQEWVFEIVGFADSSPAVADGTVYAGGSTALYAVSAETAPRATATLTETPTSTDSPEGSLPLAGVGLVGLTLAGLSYRRRQQDDPVELPEYHCGYTFLAGSATDAGRQPSIPRRHCCVRAALPDAERCGIHASPADTESKQDALGELGGVGPVLDGAILPGSLADELDLTGVTHLRDADLSGASLDGADFSGVNLRGTDLSRSDLTDADLSRADLTGVDLRDATLTATDVTAATLRETRVIDHHGEQTDATKQILHNLGAIGGSL